MVEFIDRINRSIDAIKGVVAEASQAGIEQAHVDRWTDNLDALMIHPGSVETRIGFIGRTGAGKSQALNAILGESDIFPTSGYKACTATVIEAKYHPNDNYKAVLEFVTMREWEQKVEELISELFSPSQPRENEVQDRLEEEQQVKDVRGTIKEILQALLGERVTDRQINNRENLKTLFDRATEQNQNLLSDGNEPITEDIECDNRDDFQDAIRPYVTNDAIGVKCYWPLVSKCSIYHNWEVLQDGVILVDLPGIADANYVRGGVAKAYLDKCHALFVVANSVRALDDRDARNLGLKLHKELSRQLQMDGKLNTVSFVLTQIDNYQPEELTREEGFRAEWRELKNRLNKVKLDLRRAENGTDANDWERARELRLKEKRILEEVHSVEMRCLHSRNDRQKARVRDVYLAQVREERGGRVGRLPEFTVDVHFISAKCALESSNSLWRMEDTGIPELRIHLHDFVQSQITKIARRNLRLIYQRTALLATLLANLTVSNQTLRSNISSEMLESVINLTKEEINNWRNDLIHRIEGHSLQNQLRLGADKAKSDGTKTQTGWRHRLMYHTYRCAMEGHGEFYSSGRWGHIEMNQALVDPILEAIKIDWEEIFGITLIPALEEEMKTRIENRLSHETQIDGQSQEQGAAEDFNIEESEYIRYTMSHYMKQNTLICIQDGIDGCSEMIQRQQQCWRRVKQNVQRALTDGYRRAACESGSGMLERMNEIMISEIQLHDVMFDEAVHLIQSNLLQLVDDVKSRMLSALDRMRQRVRRDAAMIMHADYQRHCARLVYLLSRESEAVIEICREFNVEHDGDSQRQLIIAVEITRDYIRWGDLSGILEGLSLEDEPGHCVICLQNEPVWIAVHGERSHKVMCGRCKEEYESRPYGQMCPVCRQTVERFTTVIEV